MSKYLYQYPPHGSARGARAWANPMNWWAARRVGRTDNSNVWRYAFHRGRPIDQTRTAPFDVLAKKSVGRRAPVDRRLRFLILADTGEGDRSQYALLPAINGLEPDFMLINGDVAYPAGSLADFEAGFFVPYQGLGIPIWAVPGNHEYYSPGKGEEFFEVFCTRRHYAAWEDYGLDLVPQPGTYWMIRDAWQPGTAGFKLGVIGLDSGHSGNLDGARKYGVGPLRFGPRSFEGDDFHQHSWLDTRLKEGDAANASIIVMFHIPSLVNEKRDGKVFLNTVHEILASHPSVKLVVCGHIHNFQRYTQALFGRFLKDCTKRDPLASPDYVVSGAGGAYISSTDFGNNTPYGKADAFPTSKQFNDYIDGVRAGLNTLGMGRSTFYRMAEKFKNAEVLDDDPVQYGSLLCVDVYDDRAEVSSLFIENLEQLYDHPTGTIISLADRQFALTPSAIDQCLGRPGRQPIVLR